MRINLIIILSAGLFSCTKTSDNKLINNTTDSVGTLEKVEKVEKVETIDATNYDYAELFKLDSYLTKNAIDEERLETVDYDCAILIYPTESQIEEMKRTEGEETFYIAADDSNWYQGQAIGIIDSLGIKTFTAKGRYLRLKGQRETWDLDIRKKNLPAWNLIFFKRSKEPEIISTIDLTVDKARDYFEIGE